MYPSILAAYAAFQMQPLLAKKAAQIFLLEGSCPLQSTGIKRHLEAAVALDLYHNSYHLLLPLLPNHPLGNNNNSMLLVVAIAGNSHQQLPTVIIMLWHNKLTQK
jgi:hypothetical protein